RRATRVPGRRGVAVPARRSRRPAAVRAVGARRSGSAVLLSAVRGDRGVAVGNVLRRQRRRRDRRRAGRSQMDRRQRGRLRHRRAVLVVPGPGTWGASVGCHVMLREWGEAVCVTDTAEILDLVGLVGDDLAPEKRGPVLDRDRLTPVTREVLEAIPARGGAG